MHETTLFTKNYYDAVGAIEGSDVGVPVGYCVFGTRVGATDGRALGDCEDAAVGIIAGLWEGIAVGSAVETLVVGECVGFSLE